MNEDQIIIENSRRRKARKRLEREPSLRRQLTGVSRVLPNALIVGAQRSGTSSCYSYLRQHPSIIGPKWKELHFFDREENYIRGLNWYRSYFKTKDRLERLRLANNQQIVVIEATPEYMFRDRAPARMAHHLPNAQLIALLRDPAERALSQYKLATRRGNVRGTFDELIHAQLEDDTADQSVSVRRAGSFIRRGYYAEQLERLYRFYPRERVHVEFAEDLYANPTDCCSRIFDFLGRAEFEIPDTRTHGRSKDRQILNPDTDALLREHYAPHNERLATLLDREVNWWK